MSKLDEVKEEIKEREKLKEELEKEIIQSENLINRIKKQSKEKGKKGKD